jgi:hypothetical protein
VVCDNGRVVPQLLPSHGRQTRVGLSSRVGAFDFAKMGEQEYVHMKLREDDGDPYSTTWLVTGAERGAFALWTWGGDAMRLTTLTKFVVRLNLYAKGYATATFLLPNRDLFESCSGRVPLGLGASTGGKVVLGGQPDSHAPKGNRTPVTTLKEWCPDR